MSYGKTSSNVWGPVLLAQTEGGFKSDALEVSVHTLPRPLQREFKHVFPEPNLQLETFNIADGCGAEFLAVPTNQPAKEDLVAIGDNIEKEKDRLLNVFMAFAGAVCQKIRDRGFWADFIDPCSGLPMLTKNCNKVYSEVDGMELCLGYKAFNAGCCKILTHPKWGSSVYPATIFAYAPQQLILEIVQAYPSFEM